MNTSVCGRSFYRVNECPESLNHFNIELGVAQQPIDLLDGIFAVQTVGQGQTVTNGMNRQRARFNHPKVALANESTRLACIS